MLIYVKATPNGSATKLIAIARACYGTVASCEWPGPLYIRIDPEDAVTVRELIAESELEIVQERP